MLVFQVIFNESVKSSISLRLSVFKRIRVSLFVK